MSVAYLLELDLLDALVPPEFQHDLPMFREAIEAVRSGDEDRLIAWPDGDELFARAHQIVALFDLAAFTLPKS